MHEDRQIHLVEKLSEARGYYGAVILTYGAEFTFFEEVILPLLRQNGCRNILVMMDGARYADTIRNFTGSVARTGMRYLPIPIRPGPFASFHPKMVLLVGEKSGRLLVGSGNLTFAGYGHNLETYSCVDWTPEECQYQPLFRDAWLMVEKIVGQWVTSRNACETVDKIQHVAKWLKHKLDGEPAPETRLVHSIDESILSQIVKILGSETVNALSVVTPFLDGESYALESLHQQLQPMHVHLILQNGRAVGNVEKLHRLQASGMPLSVSTLDDDSRYLHAKIYCIETDRRQYLLSGSANCTVAGLLQKPPLGNVEAMLLTTSEGQNTHESLLSGLELTHQAESFANLTLRVQPPRSSEGDTAEFSLLDITLTDHVLAADIQVPDNTSLDDLYIQLSTVPQLTFPLTELRSVADSTWQVTLTEHDLELFCRPVSAWIAQSIAGESRPVSNLLWVTYTDLLQYGDIHDIRTFARSAEYLAHSLLAADEEWLELYQVLANLIDLEVAVVSDPETPRPPSGPIRNGGDRKPGEPDIVVIVDEFVQPNEAIERAVFRDSTLSVFLDQMLASLPGGSKSGHGPIPPNPGETPPGPTPPRRPAKPTASTTKSFLRLVSKYISSLRNGEYVPNKSVFVVLAHYILFQRILVVLLRHNGIDVKQYVQLSMSINSAWFTPLGDLVPLADPRWSRHLQRAKRADWLEGRICGSALLSLLLTRSILPSVTDDEVKSEAYAQMLPVMAGTISIVGLENFAGIEGLLDGLDFAGFDVFEGFAQTANEFVESAYTAIQIQLREWVSGLDSFQTGEGHKSATHLEMARIQYMSARFELSAVRKDISAMRDISETLAFWARKAGDLDLSNQWYKTFLNLFAQDSADSSRASVLLEYGKQLASQKRLTEAVMTLRKALETAVEVGDEKIAHHIRTSLSWYEAQLPRNGLDKS